MLDISESLPLGALWEALGEKELEEYNTVMRGLIFLMLLGESASV